MNDKPSKFSCPQVSIFYSILLTLLSDCFFEKCTATENVWPYQKDIQYTLADMVGQGACQVSLRSVGCFLIKFNAKLHSQ